MNNSPDGPPTAKSKLVYVVISGSYSDQKICGVFSSEDKALEAKNLFVDSKITEFVLDDLPPYQNMKRWEIWIEGYLITGMECIQQKARKLGEVEAESFQAACDRLCSPPEFLDLWGNYDPNGPALWGRRLFDNEEDARLSFG